MAQPYFSTLLYSYIDRQMHDDMHFCMGPVIIAIAVASDGSNVVEIMRTGI